MPTIVQENCIYPIREGILESEEEEACRTKLKRRHWIAPFSSLVERNSDVVELLLRLSNPPDSYRRLTESVEPGTLKALPQRPELKPRQIQTRLTPEQLAQLLERYRKGERAFRLAQAFNIDRRTVANILVRAGVRRPRSMTEGERLEATRLYKEGWSCVRIGEHLGRNHGTIWRALKVAGVRLRDSHGDEAQDLSS